MIEREFERFGRLQKVELVCDPSGYSRGFGFVTYDHQEVWKTQINVTTYMQTFLYALLLLLYSTK